VTNLELLRELRKPGKIFMPVTTQHDVVHLAVEKAYLIDILQQQPPAETAWWGFVGDDQNRTGERWLDVNS
jgi:hypothetical protein